MGDVLPPNVPPVSQWPRARRRLTTTSAWLNDTGHMIPVHTTEGIMECSPGDYLLIDAKGHLYPCKPDVFAVTYDMLME